MEQPENERFAKLNEGWYKVYRISKLKENCHDARLFDDHKRWFVSLQGIRSEINSKLTKELTKKAKEGDKTERDAADEYELAIKAWLNNDNKRTVTIGKHTGTVADINIHDLLYEYELWLEDMKEKYKLGMPEIEDDDGL